MTAAMEDFMEFWSAFSGTTGFDVLRKYIKQSNETCRGLATILQERVELEATYSKKLAMISAKVTKTASQCLGTMESAWQAVAASMAEEAEYHKQLASSIEELVLHPMRNLADTYYKTRKPVEAAVEKTSRVLIQLRSDESRLKKLSYTQAKESEKCYEQYSAAKLSSRGNTDKDIGKLEKKSRTCDESARKVEKDYYDSALKAETARLEWEASVYKGCARLQILEFGRLRECHEMMKVYHYHLSAITGMHKNLTERLNAAIVKVNVSDDMKKMIELRGCGPNQPEQMMVDFYAEDMTIAIDSERREHYLKCYHAFAWQDWEKENKTKEGIEKLLNVYKDNPKFSDKENQEDIRHKLISANSLINYLEICQYKISCSLALVKKTPRPTHRFANYLEFTKDRHNLPQSILRVPVSELAFPAPDGFMSVTNRRNPTSSNDLVDHMGDYSEFDDDFDEDFDEPSIQPSNSSVYQAQPNHSRLSRFPSSSSNSSMMSRQSSLAGGRQSSVVARQTSVDSHMGAQVPRQPSMNEPMKRVAPISPRGKSTTEVRQSATKVEATRTVIGWCKAMYDFEARDEAELGMKKGEIVSIYDKVDGTWWEGELKGNVGLFPSNYVEEF